ncbi:uncharacterized protein LAJ45_03754 [Morchella importuna]|uniref:uncharacterized protein n=1 Tax=Morchella importuna TaxID=1174673 RepID=UPI001E8CE891|nr:uncharacterized protein LAJ45_03754 [Morchella importuna]KAH8152327.1 hypothetical protein LAJ45_03754 [Morchella importuna]
MQTLASPTNASTPPPSSASAQSEYARFRACDECRRRKIKCDGRISGCRHCVNSSVHCVYNTPTKTTRKRASSSQSSKHLPDAETAVILEERLERIERAVKEHLANRLSSVTREDESSQDDPEHADVTPKRPRRHGIAETAAAVGGDLTAKQNSHNPNPQKHQALYHWKISDEEGTTERITADEGLIEDFQGKLKFIGESSVFSLFLPRGMQWVCEKLGEPHFFDPLNRAALTQWTLNSPSGNIIDISMAGLPPGEEEPLPSRQVVRKLVNDYFDRINCVIPIFSRSRFSTELAMFQQNGHRASPSWLISLHSILALALLFNPVNEPVAERKAAEKTGLALFRTGCRHVPKVLFCNRDISGMQALLVTILFLWETHSTEGCFTLLGVAVSIGTEIGFHRCGTQLGLQEESEVELRRNVFWSAYILDKDMSLRIGRPSSIADEDINSDFKTWKVGCELMADGEVDGGRPERAQHLLRLKLVYYACLTAINRPLCPAFDLQDTADAEVPPTTPIAATKLQGYESCIYAARESISLIDVFEQLGEPGAETVWDDIGRIRKVSEFLRKGVEAGCPNLSEMFFLTFTLCSMATKSVERLGSMGGSAAGNAEGVGRRRMVPARWVHRSLEV